MIGWHTDPNIANMPSPPVSIFAALFVAEARSESATKRGCDACVACEPLIDPAAISYMAWLGVALHPPLILYLMII